MTAGIASSQPSPNVTVAAPATDARHIPNQPPIHFGSYGRKGAYPTENGCRTSSPQGHRTARRPSPGLLARMQLLDKQNNKRVISNQAIGPEKIERIPESQLRELDSLHRDHSIRIESRGRTWSGPYPGSVLQLPGGSAGVTVMEVQLDHDSDHSSVISTSERMEASDSEQSGSVDILEEDNLKYRLPEIGKTRLVSRNNDEREDGCTQSTARSPTPPLKDTPLLSNSPSRSEADTEHAPTGETSDSESYFSPNAASRANSVHSLSRASLTNQLSQLTAIKLPQASSLSTSISAIPTSTAAARALSEAAERLRIWIQKASEVLNGLDAEDDVEWAAAGGREGLSEVDSAIDTFESLIDLYVTAIEELQSRKDITSLPAETLQNLVERMEGILQDWKKVRQTLRGVKEQVEIAMEWEELWGTVLGEIGLEMEGLSRLIFEMEERRHRSANAGDMAESGSSLDIGELETIVEEAPSRNQRKTATNRFSLPPAFDAGSTAEAPVSPQTAQEDSNLFALFARMQPLRASLDFLPMRLSVFHSRANSVFPTACEELEKRRNLLEGRWRKLEADAESLRKELGEDRWVAVFRNAGGKTLKMCESISRSLAKLREALDEDWHHTNISETAKKIESYEHKKRYYGSAIEKVLATIDRGINDRATVNGEILRIQSVMRDKWTELESEMTEMDFVLEELSINKNQQLRDSISTILSTERSVSSSVVDTPGSSPASSVVFMSRQNSEQALSTPYTNGRSRQSSFASNSKAQPNSNKRYSSLPSKLSNATHIPRKNSTSRSSAADTAPPRSPSSASRFSSSTATPSHSYSPNPNPSSNPTSTKPRWNSSTKVDDSPLGHASKPLTPSPHRRTGTPLPTSPATRTPRAVSHSALPVPSPLSRTLPFSSPPSNSSRPPSSLSTATAPQTPGSAGAPKARAPAPASAGGKRASMLPQPKVRAGVGGAGRESRAGGRGVSLGSGVLEERSRWR